MRAFREHRRRFAVRRRARSFRPGVGRKPPTTDAFVNAGIPGERTDSELYLHGEFGKHWTQGRYRFFYRAGDNPLTTAANEAHSTIRALGIEQAGSPKGSRRSSTATTTTTAWVFGYKGLFPRRDDLRPQLRLRRGPAGVLSEQHHQPEHRPRQRRSARLQMGFDVGALKQQEFNLNADFTRRVNGHDAQLAYGAEWRQGDLHRDSRGNPIPIAGAGSSGFKGLEPASTPGSSPGTTPRSTGRSSTRSTTKPSPSMHCATSTSPTSVALLTASWRVRYRVSDSLTRARLGQHRLSRAHTRTIEPAEGHHHLRQRHRASRWSPAR